MTNQDPKIICGSREQFNKRSAARPATYFQDLSPCFVSITEKEICMDTHHPAFIAAKLKYAAVIDVGNHILRDIADRHPAMLELFPVLRSIKDAPHDCLNCGGDSTGEWQAKFNLVKSQIVISDTDKIDELKKVIKSGKLRISYLQVENGKVRSVIL